MFVTLVYNESGQVAVYGPLMSDELAQRVGEATVQGEPHLRYTTAPVQEPEYNPPTMQ